jgi:hypothetical protein
MIGNCALCYNNIIFTKIVLQILVLVLGSIWLLVNFFVMKTELTVASYNDNNFTRKIATVNIQKMKY